MKTINNIYISLSFVAMVFSYASCSDVLDSAPAGRIAISDVFTDNDKTAAFLNTCYSNINQKGNRYFFYNRGPVEWCDDAWDADDISSGGGCSQAYYNGTITSSYNAAASFTTGYTNEIFWNNYWTYIRDCNIFLNNIATATVTSESDRSRWTAEAHVLRAYYYSQLLAWYGCSLPIETVPFDLGSDFGGVKRSSYYEVSKFIVADCDSALSSSSTLPWRITQTTDNGRFTKAVAEAIRSRQILFAASPLYNDNVNVSHWDTAYTITKDALAQLEAPTPQGGGYLLYNTINFPAVFAKSVANSCFPSDTAAMYNEYFNTSQVIGPTVPVDMETIYQSHDAQFQTDFVDGIGFQGGYKTGTCPSQELVDAFETTDGKPILQLDNPYADEQHTTPNYNSDNHTYDPANPYKNRDPRFYADIYYNGSKRYTYWNAPEVSGNIENYSTTTPSANTTNMRTRTIATWDGEPSTGLSSTARAMTRTGYYERKFLHPNVYANTRSANIAKSKIYRLSEAILNFAEAAAEANHLDEAWDAVNRIRTRVGMPNLPVALKADPTGLILRIHNERRVELCMEENRYFDVRRWCSPNDDLSKTDKWITAMDIHIVKNANGTYPKNADGTYQYTYSRTPVRTNPRACYTKKFLKWPLDINEANLMLQLTGESWQNPGW